MRILLRMTQICFCALTLNALSTAPARADGSTLKIGVLTDMSGPYADFAGPGSVYAVEKAVAEFSDKIKGKTISVVHADTQNKTDIAVAIARKWYTADGVDVIVGLTGSGISLAVVELAKQYNKVAIVTSALTTDLSNDKCTANSVHYGINTYALTNGVVQGLTAEGKKTWFVIAVDYAFGKSMVADTEAFVKAAGGEMKGVVWHPFNTPDFASQLVRAKESGADVIAVANAGSDVVNTVKQAAEFGLTTGKQSVAAMVLWITDAHAIGVKDTQGMLLVQDWYWDANDDTRAFAKPFFDKMSKMPSSYHAADYSSVWHMLKTIEGGADWTDGKALVGKMKQTKIDDHYARGGFIREDGMLMHDVFLFRVKKPVDSKGPWDLFNLVQVIPADKAYAPLAQSRCSLVKSN
jgi:branched-chain amino acid transport system substrate-binding protein